MTEPRAYSFNPNLKIWVTPSHDSITYSDGDAVELRLLTVLRQFLNVSGASEEIRPHITDWPSEYHLSPVRHNLLRPFAFGPGDSILELGCGCGAITRYLGETGATIVSVEGSCRRAEIAAERCRDLPNVSIYCDNLADFRTDEKFNYVTLIGVLEYAPLFIESDDPIGACLARALSFLKEEGALILAIENKLGLKYFSGCREDHVAIPYFGINDLYTAKTPVTFGKLEITRHLNRSGFGALDFFYPFPDYKLPNLILSQHGAQSDKLNLKDLLIHAVSRDYPEDYYRAFADGLAWGPVADNHLLEEMANSFLIRAYKNVGSNSKEGWLAKTYSRSHRLPEFQVATTIEPDINGNLMARKHPLAAVTEQQNIAHTSFRHVPTDCAYIHGRLLLRDIQLTIVREESLEVIATCFKPWLSYLCAHETPEKNGKRMLPGNFIDCIPANLIATDAGSIKFFDAEWLSKDDIPMSWVLIRGIIYSVIGCLSSRVLADITYRQLIDAILDQTLDDSDYALAEAMEQQFLEYCHTCTGNKVSPLNITKEKISLFGRLSDAPVLIRKAATHESDLARCKSELKRIKGTVSWQITKPLRFAWNTLIKLSSSNTTHPHIAPSQHVPGNPNNNPAYSILLQHFEPEYKDRIHAYIDTLLAVDHYKGRMDYLCTVIGSEYFHPGVRMLVSGYGAGSEMIAARQAGLGEIHGVEVKKIWLEASKKRLASMPDFYPALYDGMHLPYPDGWFGMLMSGHVIEHTKDPQLYLHECMRVLAAGGYLSLEFPHRYHYTELHTQLPSLEWLPRNTRNIILGILSGRFSPLSAGAKARYASIISTGLQQISMAKIRKWLKSSGYPHTILDITKAAPGIIRCVIRRDRDIGAPSN